MRTQIRKIGSSEIDEKMLSLVVKILKSGGIIIYPTETCYGLGADALNSEIVKKVHDVKQQPHDKPISVLVSDLGMIQKIAVVDKKAKKMIEHFMPGPLTLILEKKEIVPGILTKSGIGIRISSNPVAHSIVKRFGRPITTTSANIYGQPPIYDSRQIIRFFKNKVDLIIDAGDLYPTEPSSVYDYRTGKILREGPIYEEELVRFK